MYDTGVLDLDYETDFELMEVIANYLFKAYVEFQEVNEHIPKCNEGASITIGELWG